MTVPSNITVQETKPLELDCRSSILGHVFRGSNRTWYLNGKMIKQISKVRADISKTDVIPAVDRRVGGVWECVVTSETGARRWKTAIYTVTVTPPPLLKDVVIERFRANLIPNSIVAIGIVMFIVVICVGILYKAESTEGQKNNEFENLKEQIEKMKSTHQMEDDQEQNTEST